MPAACFSDRSKQGAAGEPVRGWLLRMDPQVSIIDLPVLRNPGAAGMLLRRWTARLGGLRNAVLKGSRKETEADERAHEEQNRPGE